MSRAGDDLFLSLLQAVRIVDMVTHPRSTMALLSGADLAMAERFSVHRGVWRTALHLAGGDRGRIQVVDRGTLIVHNRSPWYGDLPIVMPLHSKASGSLTQQGKRGSVQ